MNFPKSDTMLRSRASLPSSQSVIAATRKRTNARVAAQGQLPNISPTMTKVSGMRTNVSELGRFIRRMTAQGMHPARRGTQGRRFTRLPRLPSPNAVI